MKSDRFTTSYRVDLGMIDYKTTWSLQQKLADARAAKRIPDTLLLLEHPPTYTLGRSGKQEHLLMSREECQVQGIAVYDDVDRGGDITFHGPGQLVAYPICFLGLTDASGCLVQSDYVGYVRRLEDVLIKTVAAFGIAGQRKRGLTGVWVNTDEGVAKIAAIGVHVSARGVSTHGTALNVTTDLQYFAGIVPCGIQESQICSMRSLLGTSAPTMEEVKTQFAVSYQNIFTVDLAPRSLHDLLDL